jgi:hypothetical protein
MGMSGWHVKNTYTWWAKERQSINKPPVQKSVNVYRTPDIKLFDRVSTGLAGHHLEQRTNSSDWPLLGWG